MKMMIIVYCIKGYLLLSGPQGMAANIIATPSFFFITPKKFTFALQWNKKNIPSVGAPSTCLASLPFLLTLTVLSIAHSVTASPPRCDRGILGNER